MLIKKFVDENITIGEFVEDADATIVCKAVEGVRQSDYVIIVEVVELLNILTALAPDSNRLSLMKPGKKKQRLSSIPQHTSKCQSEKTIHIISTRFHWMLNSTSAFFRQGKMKFAKLLDNDAGIQNAAKVFKNHHAAAFEVGAADEKIISSFVSILYSIKLKK
ncbi:hypothetical protein AVEN_215596-1 [Araneus ventricosus]|uniref:Uncharacterized protein n=1 Tax=Araneus ventricosus TaxID=182803 RepID=A0A4Y2MN05_ARAVE|nr:hypothetical protein AVEN_215596-1 [Araneus ventricosus]